jgi:hypothetical protein
MPLRLRQKIQEMLHGQGEVIRPMPKFTEKSLIEDYILERSKGNTMIISGRS